MSDPRDLSFEHGSTFIPGEVSGNLGLGKFEDMYSELFADVIEDGVITPEERRELERTAAALGLDKQRLRALEAALQAVYEERHRVRIVEMTDASDDAPASIMLAAPTDPRTQVLVRRVAELEARVAVLEKELEEARAQADRLLKTS